MPPNNTLAPELIYSNENTISLEFISFVSRQKTLAFRYEK